MDLIQRYQSVEAIYADLEAVEAKPAVLKKLGEGREQARMSYELATIRCDAPVRFTPEEALRRPVNEPVLYEPVSYTHLDVYKRQVYWRR